MFFDRLKYVAVAASLAVAPMSANASVLDPLNTIADGGSYNMIGGNFFGETFLNADGAGSRSFTFNNLNAVDNNILVTVATVNALTAQFAGTGVVFQWLVSGLTLNVLPTVTNFSGTLNNTIAAGGSDTLVVTFGDPTDRGKNAGRANFTVSLDASPVPVPAAGFLLAGALGGLAALRRRKATAV